MAKNMRKASPFRLVMALGQANMQRIGEAGAS